MENILSYNTLTYLKENFHPDKVRHMSNILNIINDLLKTNNIDISYTTHMLIDEVLEDYIVNIDSLDKDELNTSIDNYILKYITSYLEYIGIVIDIDILLDKGSPYTILSNILIGINNMLNCNIEEARLLIDWIDSEYEDTTQLLAEWLANTIANSHPIQFYEVISDVTDKFIDNIVYKARLVLLSDVPAIDNNIVHYVNKLIKYSNTYIDTIVLKHVLNTNDIDTIENNLLKVYNSNEYKEVTTGNELRYEKLIRELLVAIYLSKDYILDPIVNLNSINLEILQVNLGNDVAKYIKDNIHTRLQELYML